MISSVLFKQKIFWHFLFSEEKFDINSIIKKPLVVSENLETLELLKEFKENKKNMSIWLLLLMNLVVLKV